MKIERINENQIKFTLTRSDLASRQLRMSELAYCTDKAKGLFQDMMDQASLEFGFDTSEFPFMIETIPVSMDCIILMITKVDDPQEMDSRFSTIANFNDMFGRDPSDIFDLSSIFGDSSGSEAVEPTQVPAMVSKPDTHSGEAFFSFASIENVIDFAKSAAGYAFEDSSLYKSNENGRYFLSVRPASSKHTDFAQLCGTALEFGNSEPVNYSRAAYIKEHFEIIIEGTALQDLSYV